MRALPLLCILALVVACGDGTPDGKDRGKARLELITGARSGVDVDWLVDFGSVTPGEKRTRVLVFRNAGDAPTTVEPLHLDAPFFSDLEAPVEVQAGALLEVEVGVVVSDLSPIERVARLSWKEGAFDLRLRAGGADCAYELSGGPIDFGMVEVGRLAQASVVIESIGLGSCRIDWVSVEGAGFQAPERSPAIVRPGLRYTVPVTYSPETDLESHGILHLEVGGDSHEIPLVGNGTEHCLLVEPGTLDFGTVATCAVGYQQVEIENLCSQPVHFREARTGNIAFSAVDYPSRGTALDPGTRHEIVLQFVWPWEGTFEDVLEVVTDELDPVEVPLVAQAVGETMMISEEIEVPVAPRVDVLVLVDDTDRMTPWVDRLEGFAVNLGHTLDAYDFHLGVTTASMETTPGCADAPAGRLLPLDGNDGPRVLDADTPDLVDEIAARLQQGTCQNGALASASTATFEATGRLAVLEDDPLTELPGDGNLGFRREGADLALLYLLADDDPIFYLPVEEMGRTLQLNNPQSQVLVELWSPMCEGIVANDFHFLAMNYGMSHDLCASPLQGPFLFGRGVPDLYLVFGTPADVDGDGKITWEAGEFLVEVDGVEIPATDPDTGELIWSYNTAGNVLRFEPGHRPPGGSRLTLSYHQLCTFDDS